MKRPAVWMGMLVLACALPLFSQNNAKLSDNPSVPTWWAKYQYLLNNGVNGNSGPTKSLSASGRRFERMRAAKRDLHYD